MKNNGADPENILAALSHARGPMTPAELSDLLEVGDHRAEFEAALAGLEHAGRVVRNRAGLLLVAARANLLSGRVQGHRDGYGFLIRDDGGADLVLPEHEMSRVLHGDRVLARPAGQDRRGRPLGEVVEVIEHRTNRLVGRLLNERGVTIVVPEDQRISHDILLPPGATAGAEHGQVVVVEIVQQPQRHVQPVGRVVEVLGAIDDPGMEIEIAVRKFAVPHEFPPAALAAAEELPSQVEPRELRGRVDLRDVPLVTIDGEDARDFDDAVYCEPINARRTRWRLIVAIADVSHYVPAGGALDAEAQNRSTSVYFPRRVIPMLPEKLSNGICSLNPKVDRLVMVADLVISARGAITAYQFYPAVMHSHARLTYSEVWEALSVPESRAVQRLAAVMPQLADLHDLYRLLAKARGARGALEMDTTETYIVCDAQGRIEKILPRTDDARRQRLRGRPAGAAQAPGALPDSRGADTGAAGEPAHAAQGARPESRWRRSAAAEGLRRAARAHPQPPRHAAAADGPAAHDAAGGLQPAQRRPLRACLRGVRALHLADPALSRPAGSSGDQGGAEQEGVRAAAAGGDGRAGGAARGAAARRPHDDGARRGAAVGEARPAVLGQRAAGRRRLARRRGLAEIFVVLDDLFVEGLVHVSELGSEYFQFNEPMHELRGERTGLRYRLADRVSVQVARVDLEARRIEFRLVRGVDRKSVLGAEPAGDKLPRRKGESVERRRERLDAAQARHGRDIDKREKARGGKQGVGGEPAAGARRRGRS